MPNKLTTKMWEAIANSPYVMIGLNKNAEHSEPMRAQLDKQANGYFWFYTTTDNRIADGGKAMAQFSSKDHDLFACLSGKLVEETDEEVISKYWSNAVEAWYPEGRQDPKLKMMRFDLATAEVWSVDPTITGMIKLASGADISAQEMGDHEKVSF